MEKNSDDVDIASLRSRWSSYDGQQILEKLFSEKMQLADMRSAMEAAKKRFEIVDIRAVDFSEKDLSHHFLLFDLDLSYSNFSNAKIQGSFQNSTMRNCKFDSAEIIGGFFAGANLAASTFKGSVIQDADFENALLPSVSFENALLVGVGFQNTDLTSANFTGAHFGRVKFGNTKLLKTKELYEAISQSETVLNAEGIVWVERS